MSGRCRVRTYIIHRNKNSRIGDESFPVRLLFS